MQLLEEQMSQQHWHGKSGKAVVSYVSKWIFGKTTRIEVGIANTLTVSKISI